MEPGRIPKVIGVIAVIVIIIIVVINFTGKKAGTTCKVDSPVENGVYTYDSKKTCVLSNCQTAYTLKGGKCVTIQSDNCNTKTSENGKWTFNETTGTCLLTCNDDSFVEVENKCISNDENACDTMTDDNGTWNYEDGNCNLKCNENYTMNDEGYTATCMLSEQYQCESKGNDTGNEWVPDKDDPNKGECKKTKCINGYSLDDKTNRCVCHPERTDTGTSCVCKYPSGKNLKECNLINKTCKPEKKIVNALSYNLNSDYKCVVDKCNPGNDKYTFTTNKKTNKCDIKCKGNWSDEAKKCETCPKFKTKDKKHCLGVNDVCGKWGPGNLREKIIFSDDGKNFQCCKKKLGGGKGDCDAPF